MDDLISRQAAIDALLHLTERWYDALLKSLRDTSIGDDAGSDDYEGWLGGVLDCVDALAELPPAQPEQPIIEERNRGAWIPQNHNKINGMASTAIYYYPKCSVCGHCGNYTDFCPNCGADMRGE